MHIHASLGYNRAHCLSGILISNNSQLVDDLYKRFGGVSRYVLHKATTELYEVAIPNNQMSQEEIQFGELGDDKKKTIRSLIVDKLSNEIQKALNRSDSLKVLYSQGHF